MGEETRDNLADASGLNAAELWVTATTEVAGNVLDGEGI